MKNILYTIILSFLFANTSLAMTLGVITVNKYLDMSEIEQTIVVAGIVDGIIAQDFFMLNSIDLTHPNQHPEDTGMSFPWLTNCIKSGFTLDQMKAILDKFIKENPEQWNVTVAVLLLKTTYESCIQ